MAVTHADINSFNSFALSRLNSGGAESISELFDLFLIENPTDDETADVHSAISQSLEDIEAGMGRPADQVLTELRQKHGLQKP
jgi:hypothetical protein